MDDSSSRPLPSSDEDAPLAAHGATASPTPPLLPPMWRRAWRPRRRRPSSESPQWSRLLVTVFVPTFLLTLLAAVSVVAFALSPRPTGPLASGVTLGLVAITVPLVFAAARRLGLTRVASLVAAALATFVLPTASSDVAGVAEHLAVPLGLLAVALWPPSAAGAPSRHAAAALSGAAIAVSPLAALAVIGVVLWLLKAPEGRRSRRQRIVQVLPTGAAVFAVTMLVLVLTDWIAGTTWGGQLQFATIVVSVAPAIGVAAGIGVDAAIAAIGLGDLPSLLFASVGLVLIGLMLAVTGGATASQIRDRAVSGQLEIPRPSPSPAVDVRPGS